VERKTTPVAKSLGISPVTLRLWCRTFGSDIGIIQTANGRYVYTDEVIRHFQKVKQALAVGMTYKDVQALYANGQIDDIRLPLLPDASLELAFKPMGEAIISAIEGQTEVIKSLEARIRYLEDLLSERQALPEKTPTLSATPTAIISDTPFYCRTEDTLSEPVKKRWWKRSEKKDSQRLTGKPL
jgi:DNA-binding transcriptional MerR regulator